MAIALPDTKRLPALIARARREANVAQQALANALEISLRTLSRWETGKHYPEPEQARDLAYALSRASGETWRALVDALRLPLGEMLAEEADMSPRRLRLVLGLLIGELRLLGVGLDEAYALVMRVPRPMRARAR